VNNTTANIVTFFIVLLEAAAAGAHADAEFIPVR
jgi:hypothetical protein